MANGRQRKRDVLLAKKAAEQAARDGLAGLSPEGLTSIVSNDSNDLDNISYSTTDGATVNIKNNRVKDSTPNVNVLGGRKGYMPGNGNFADAGPSTRSNLGGRKGYMPGSNIPDTGPNTRGSFRPDDELILAEGPNTRSNLGGRKGYMPGSNNITSGPTTRSNLGGRKGYMPGNDITAGGPTTRNNLGGRKGYMPGSTGSQGPTTRSSKGFNLDDEMLLSDGPNVRGSARPQAKAITEFIGEDLSPEANNQFYTVDMDSADDLVLQQDNSVIGETLNDDGTVTYELPPSNLGDPEVTKHELTEAQLEPGIYDNVEPGEELALTPTLDNKGYNFDDEGNPIAEQPLLGRMTEGERAQAALDLEEQLKEEALTKQLEADTKDTGLRKGYMPGNNNFADAGPSTRSNLGGRKGYLPGDTQDGPSVRGSGNFDGRKGYKPGNDNDGVDSDLVDAQLEEIYGIEDGTVKSKDSTDVIKAREELAMIDQQAGSGLLEEGEITPETAYPNIHENEPGTTPPEAVAKEVGDAEKDIQAAQAGNPHFDGIVEDAKTEVEKVKKEVEDGVTAPETAAEKIKNSLGSLGELLGIDGKDLIRALFRYAGGRIFGMSGNEAGRFMYEGFMTDEAAEAKVEAAKLENMGLGTGATAQQKNLKAYKEEIKRIDDDASLSTEEKIAAKKTANEVFKVNEPTTMGRPLNIQARLPDGSEEIVAARRNENNSYDVFMNDQWVPIELSGLTDIQITGRNTEQAFEKGMADPRNDVNIDNATYVSSGGVPTFKHKNESERKSYQLAKRAVDVYPVIDAMMKDPEMLEHITSAMGGLQTYAAGNANAKITAASINLAIGDSIPQKYRSATQAWLQALLRADTGAAYSETEIMDYIATNIPQVGDLPDTVAFKIAQMKSTTETMAANSGQGAKYLLGRLDGSIEPPESVKRLQSLGMSTNTESDDGTDRSTALQSALDQY